ncbi:hypothetical protein BMR07_11575 [Methylococcaceae bacterium CS1]|nr:hypothetical protein [Methyloprofundus sp.]TXK98799.1 hypothetical protein BMR10_02055 [Methylococcaceae bacterium CS4]TXK99127.1 hypothetical protein BMR11_07285 [Methylococcaceae bacterium CS5]TXL04750.1 hypothetical protein BMR07_11575 [Methylococcaceae bacterium CS1]TXL06639.1 hypothetical protein BMR09_07450 [Methylococcaceae bacterium CS3]TXL10770.1 hypothetical protein BMR08_07290 [Methylococcaceae bacterium CS2]
MAISEQQLQSDLLLAGASRAVALVSLIVLVVICHIYSDKIQIGMEEQQRVLIRTVLYVVAITTFPLMKFMRHVLLRLNQTTKSSSTSKSRYMLTIAISMLVAESIGIYGFVMYLLGDSFNTLYIFTGLSALAMYLYKPKIEEYRTIIESAEPAH